MKMPWTKALKYKEGEKAYKAAQHLHALEHENEMPPTLKCDDVGHLPLIDVYQGYGDDETRRFCMATGRDW
jgi:hypothetical protein